MKKLLGIIGGTVVGVAAIAGGLYAYKHKADIDSELELDDSSDEEVEVVDISTEEE